MITSPDPRLTRPLTLPVAIVALTAVLLAYIILMRLWHGSWAMTGAAAIAPGIVAIFALGLWTYERRRGPLGAALTVGLFVLIAAAAGALASAVTSRLGSITIGAVGGVIWGAIIGAGWARSRRRTV